MAFRRPLHILVVDCDETIMIVVTALLERMGYTTRGETESLKALRTFSDYPEDFDLAIMEPLLPELTGTELATRFRRIRRGFPILFYSGYVDPSLADMIEGTGLGHIALKPMYSDELRDAVEKAMHPPHNN